MAAQSKSKEQQTDREMARWCPEGEVTIYTALKNKSDLMALISDSDRIEIDLSKVSEIDTAGLQLLLLAKREAVGAGKSLQLSGHSDAIVEAFELSDLSAFFGDPVVIPSEQKTPRRKRS